MGSWRQQRNYQNPRKRRERSGRNKTSPRTIKPPGQPLLVLRHTAGHLLATHAAEGGQRLKRAVLNTSSHIQREEYGRTLSVLEQFNSTWLDETSLSIPGSTGAAFRLHRILSYSCTFDVLSKNQMHSYESEEIWSTSTS